MRIVRGVAGLLGEALVTLGVVLLLFVGWQLWWTDVVSDADSAQVVATMQQEFDDPSSAWVHPDKAMPGDAFAIVRVPRFGEKFARPLYEGTTSDVLARGIGHYTGTALPGEVGNFAMAGHRTTYGKPFNKVAELKAGDLIIVETRESYFVYEVYEDLIVAPTQTEVVAPVPGRRLGEQPTEALMTMTSCHPMFSSRQRWVTHSRLIQTIPHDQGLPPELLEVSG